MDGVLYGPLALAYIMSAAKLISEENLELIYS